VAILVNHYERRAGQDLEALANAAYDYCCASRTIPGIRSCRFYWVNADLMVIQAEAESFEIFDRPGTPEAAKAAFTLFDLARNVGTERWAEPRMAEQSYRQAGR
jgi:hypothetical protein